MLAGRPPFDGATPTDVMAAILRADPVPLDLHALRAPQALARVSARTLAKDVADRFPDARELHAELAALKTELDSAAGRAYDVTEQVRAARPVPNNLPIQITAFVGREDDVAGVREALRASRLVTLTGAGGVGKTRLALQVGAELLDRFFDGVWLVNLGSLLDPALVAATVADVLGVRQRPDRPIVETLCEHLQPSTLLIVLDNCEHLIEAAATLVHRLLVSCRDVTVLATSRETLNVPGEVGWRLRSLGVPGAAGGDVAAVIGTESVRLFTQRARTVRPSFEVTEENAAAIAQICRRLDGLPLAIELAAARVRAMSPIEIAERLDDRFRLLTGGSRMAVARQRTLEATVSWSYELLAEPERELFERLAVFAGGWPLAAVERVCVDDARQDVDIADRLAHLVDRSLVLADEMPDGRTRYRQLETLRQFGRDRLIAGGHMTALRNRHLVWAVALAEGAPPPSGHLPPPDIAADIDNLRAALEWACDTGAWEAALRIMSSVWFGHFDERKRRLKQLLPFADQTPAGRSREGAVCGRHARLHDRRLALGRRGPGGRRGGRRGGGRRVEDVDESDLPGRVPDGVGRRRWGARRRRSGDRGRAGGPQPRSARARPPHPDLARDRTQPGRGGGVLD